MPLPLTDVFADLPDPRRDLNKQHALVDILVIATCAVISGAEGWDQVAEYGRRKETFFRRFLTLANGIPSHDTFGRVFAALDPAAFADRFARWMASACGGAGLTPIAIDGKSARRSKRATATGCLHLVSAWATANGVTLGQVSVADGSNEVAAIPELLRTLDLAGAIVTIDAAGCQVTNAEEVRRQGGHYLLAVKDNQPRLRAAVEAVFDRACDAEFAGVEHDGHEAIEDAHGRHEERYVRVIYDPAGLPPEWPGVAAVVQVNRVRAVGGRRTQTTHYYLSSHRGTARELGDRVRGHWAIEAMHWVLDVAFREDESRTRTGHAGANLGMLRRVAVSLLKRVESRGSIQTRRLMAAWDDEFLLKVVQGIPAI
jgi:predicted transposase YbfD/YdcC